MPSSTSALDLSQIMDFPISGLFATDDQNAGASALIIPASLAVVQSLGHVMLCVTPRTAACQASLSFTIS